MFTWICPKCGKEVPPSYSECPNCAAGEVEAPPETAVAAPVETPAAAPHAAAPPPPAHKSKGRHYLEGIIAAVTIIVVVLTVVAILRTGVFRKESAAPAPEAAKAQAPLVAPAVETNPVFKSIEITGFRLTEDKQQKPQLQFVVVNHSAADVGEVKAQANLRVQTAKPEEAPVGTFALAVTLGPYEAKDMRVPLQTKLRAYELPDWQLLRVELVP